MWTDIANKEGNSSWFQFNLRADPMLLNTKLLWFLCVVLYSALIFFSIVLIFLQLIKSTIDTSIEITEVSMYTNEFLMCCIIHVVYLFQSCKSNCWYHCPSEEGKSM